jgi:uncharacterized protein
MSWYRKAADQRDARAQNNLGLAYANGRGVSQDYIEAYKWFNGAAAIASHKDVRERAMKHQDAVAKKMTPEQIAEAQKRASEWKRK